MTDQAKTATLEFEGKSVDLPILSGSTGPDVIDIRKLYGGTGAFTFDPGFTSTASCESGLTYIDGDAGVLLHRGYPIDQLASKSNFVEVCHLLLHGELPTAAQYEKFENSITMHTMLHSQFDRFFEGFRRDAHPMAIMVGTVGALSAFYHDSLDIHDPVQRDISAIRLIAKMPTIAARAYKYHIGQPFVSPRNDLSYAENFLRMCFAVPAEDWDDSRTFDAVLLDAPCTATGTFRRNPEVLRATRPSDVAKLADVQHRLLDVAAERVKPGGRLVYCTCSLEREEGETQIIAFLRRNPAFRTVPADPAAVGAPAQALTPEGWLRILPSMQAERGGLDGFFAAKLERIS
ncbi:hypothetical protein CCR92_21700 [Rhodospirillum rubrum]|nr:hypothetical protein [Rhodospirillum rubrum]